MTDGRHSSHRRFDRLRRRTFKLNVERARNQIGAAETVLYVFVGIFLLLAGGLILLDTVKGFLDGVSDGDGSLELGLRVLDRILLMLIIAELLYTLQLVIARGEIAAEPFLFIGIIAVVRRVVVITAETEKLPEGGRALTNFLLELGLLSLLVIAFGLAIYLIRKGAAEERESQADMAAAS
jgi:uncharacterized membrane protein (DUF373 family)